MKISQIKRIVVTTLIVSMLLSSCKLVQTQKMIDNIIPDYKTRMYTVADLIPYTYKEIRNALALYSQELQEFFYTNTSTPAEAKRVTKEEKDAFYMELLYRDHNYKTISNRFSMYVGDGTTVEEEKEKERQKEYDDYYKIGNAAGGNIIKKYNNGNLEGMPIMSIRVDMATATMSSLDAIYSEAECEIYKPVYIEDKKYKELKVGDTIELTVPATNSTVDAKETKTVLCTYVATDSLMYATDDDKYDYYFIANKVDGTTGVHRVLDYYGETLETYEGKHKLQFMKNARVAQANDSLRLMISVAQDSLTSYNFDELAVRALGGGYVTYEYKDYVYANSITTNLKGYITSLTHFDNQRVDNEFYETLN